MKRILSLLLILSFLCGFACAELPADAEPAMAAAPAGTEAAPEAEPGAEATPEPAAVPETEATAVPEGEAAPEVTPEPAAVPEGEILSEPAVPTLEPEVEPTPEPAPAILPESISLPETLVIGYKENVEGALRPEILPSGSVCSLTYSSAKPRYVEVDAQTGALYGARTGSAVITVTTDNGLSASCKVTVKKAPSRVKLGAGESTLAAGESTALSVSFSSSSYYSHRISYSSSNEEVVRVEEDRAVAIAPGSAKITAEAFNGKKGSVTITVLPAPERVAFTTLPEVLGVGQTARLAAAVNEGSQGRISFSGSDDSVAAVATDGNITALSAGEITVTATAFNDVSASAVIRVLPAPESLSFAEDTVYIGVDEELENVLRPVMDENCAAEIRFSSSATRYVKVDAKTGRLSGERVGKATIVAETHNGLRAECTVIVEKAPTKVKLSVDSKTMGVGQSQLLSVSLNGRGSYTLKSSKPDVLAVDADGMLHAVGEGKAKITAKTHNGRSASLTITVSPAPTEIRAAETELSLGVGEEARLSFSVNKGSVASLSYTSSNPSVASVDAAGNVTAVASGEAVITAETQNGLSAATLVAVLPEPEAILFDGEVLTIAVGERRTVLFSTAPEKVKTRYSYASSDPAVVRVDGKGVLSGWGRGEAVITVTAANGVSSGLRVQVVPYAELNDPYVLAHRGASGYYPDNSLAAFEHAAALGADVVELDVRETRDGKLVVFHDASIEIGGKKKDIEDLRLSEIRKANPDVCTLEEALACIAATDMEVMIEFKVSGIEKEVVKCAQAAGISDRAYYASFKLNVINKVKSLLPGGRTIYLIQKEDVLEDTLGEIDAHSFDIASLKSTLLNEKTIRDLHLAGKQVVGWTLNLLSEIREAIAMGVDGVTTDYPDRVR